MRMILCIIIALLLIQCNAYKRVAADPFRSEKDIAIIAPVCATLFPPITKYVKGETVTDSSAYKNLIDEVQQILDEANTEYQKLAATAGGIASENDSIRLATGGKIEELQKIINRLKKGIPCPKNSRVDTIYQDNPATVEIFNKRLLALQTENAGITAERDAAIKKAQQAIDNKNKGWFFFAGLLALIGLYTYLKIRFKFLP